jgi:hypothetical protein
MMLFSAEAIRASQRVEGVVVPLPINPEPVFIATGVNHHGPTPHAIFFLAHGVHFGIPLVEVGHQNDLPRFWHFQLEIDPSALDHIFLWYRS